MAMNDTDGLGDNGSNCHLGYSVQGITIGIYYGRYNHSNDDPPWGLGLDAHDERGHKARRSFQSVALL